MSITDRESASGEEKNELGGSSLGGVGGGMRFACDR